MLNIIPAILLVFGASNQVVRVEAPANFTVPPANSVSVSDVVGQAAMSALDADLLVWWDGNALTTGKEPIAAQKFPAGVEAARITLNPNFDDHGYDLIVDPSDGVVLGAERYSTPKTDAEVAALRDARIAARKKDRQDILDLIQKRLDGTNVNNAVTTANGRFTVYSAEFNKVVGASATAKSGNLWRGSTLVNTASNSATFQVWGIVAGLMVKVGIETNDWNVVLTK